MRLILLMSLLLLTGCESVDSEKQSDSRDFTRQIRLDNQLKTKFRETPNPWSTNDIVDKPLKIINGPTAKSGEIPWQVIIRRTDIEQRVGSWCGGSILDEKTILTAAHCLYPPFEPKLIETQLKVGYGSASVRDMIWANVEEIRDHQEYDDYLMKSDIAILILDKPITFNDFAAPIPLPSAENFLTDGQELLVSGFGVTETGSGSNILKYTNVNFISNSDCNFVTYYDGEVWNDQFCAGYDKNQITPTDSCQGDSGGPLVAKETGELVGIVSWGEGCAKRDKPGVYTQVSQYINWIQENRQP